MELLITTAIGVAAVFRLTSDITSPDLEGPFNLYNIIRNHIASRGYPEWIKNGIVCKYCVSFWCGIALSPLYIGMVNWWLVPLWAIGLSGPTVWYHSYIDTLFPPEM